MYLPVFQLFCYSNLHSMCGSGKMSDVDVGLEPVLSSGTLLTLSSCQAAVTLATTLTVSVHNTR